MTVPHLRHRVGKTNITNAKGLPHSSETGLWQKLLRLFLLDRDPQLAEQIARLSVKVDFVVCFFS